MAVARSSAAELAAARSSGGSARCLCQARPCTQCWRPGSQHSCFPVACARRTSARARRTSSSGLSEPSLCAWRPSSTRWWYRLPLWASRTRWRLCSTRRISCLCRLDLASATRRVRRRCQWRAQAAKRHRPRARPSWLPSSGRPSRTGGTSASWRRLTRQGLITVTLKLPRASMSKCAPKSPRAFATCAPRASRTSCARSALGRRGARSGLRPMWWRSGRRRLSTQPTSPPSTSNDATERSATPPSERPRCRLPALQPPRTRRWHGRVVQ
mmetsp:Transcript_9292/g.38055  ORF Transcript_9292/g.38055 Transcript_9292/m.38055 type:complete len:270 (+) Transcript_9292:1379-2188(+)